MFNGVFSTFFNVDASVQAFAADLHSSDISSNDDFIQYPDQTDHQTYQNAILNHKSIPVSFAIEEVEAQQQVDSNSELVNTAEQSGTLAGGEQAKTVVTSQGLLSEEFPQPEMDRPWFCSVYAIAGYYMCDPITNVPKWCQYDMTDIWCPDDPGFEYDGATGQGGSSGGSGASRTWTEKKCFDENFKEEPCPLSQDRMVDLMYPDGTWTYPAGNTAIRYKKLNTVPANSVATCYDLDGVKINCNHGDVSSAMRIYPDPADRTNYIWATSVYNGNCLFQASFKEAVIGDCVIPIRVSNFEPPSNIPYSFDSSARILVPGTYVPREDDDDFKNGYPIPIPPSVPGSDPFNPEYPVTENECASIICQCISFVVKALEKVDQSILQVVAAVQALSFEVPTPAPFDISPVTDRLDDILTAVDNISIEMVKEAETNIWDFLGETISTLNDLIQYLIDQIIYLIVPEDTDFLRENFSMLRESMSMKLEPVNMLKTQITASLMTEQKNFEDIEMDLPIYGRVEFLNVEFLNYAVPKIRALISGIMIIVTSVWAYRKITSDMVR